MAQPTRIIKAWPEHFCIHIAREQSNDSLCDLVYHGIEVDINTCGRLCHHCLRLWTLLPDTPASVKLDFSFQPEPRLTKLDWQRLRMRLDARRQ